MTLCRGMCTADWVKVTSPRKILGMSFLRNENEMGFVWSSQFHVLGIRIRSIFLNWKCVFEWMNWNVMLTTLHKMLNVGAHKFLTKNNFCETFRIRIDSDSLELEVNFFECYFDELDSSNQQTKSNQKAKLRRKAHWSMKVKEMHMYFCS